jgi:hypothetical protein
MRSPLTLAVAALATIAGCAVPNLDEPEPLPVDAPASTRDSRKSAPETPAPSGSGEVLSPAPSTSASSGSNAPPAPQAKRWRGGLGATKPVEFPGGANCRYRITLQQVKVDIVAAANGDVVAANVTATAFEQVSSTTACNTPIPVHTHTYALATATVLATGFAHLELVGLSTNSPAVSLVIEGDLRTASPALSLRWHRTDYGPPLDWRVSAEITTTLQ